MKKYTDDITTWSKYVPHKILITSSKPFIYKTRSEENAEKVYKKIKPVINREKMYLQKWRTYGGYIIKAGYFV